MNFWHVVRVVQARKWIIIGLVAATFLTIVIAAPKPRVVYNASVYMSPTEQVMQGGTTTTAEAGNQSAAPNRNVILSNLIILAQGGEVYQRAMDFLALSVDEQRRKVRENMGTDLPSYQQIPRIEVEAGKMLTYQDWQEVLEVTPVQNQTVGETGTTTDIICITVKLTNGTIAPYVANAVGEAFSELYQDKSREDIRKYSKFLLASENEAKDDLKKVQQQIAAYRSDHNMTAATGESDGTLSLLTAAMAAKSEADAAAGEAQAALNDVNAQLAAQPLVRRQKLPAEMNPVVKKLQEQLLEAEADLKDLSQRYKPAHEKYKEAAAKVAYLQGQITKNGANYSLPEINQIHQDLLKKHSDAQYALATTVARRSAAAASLAQVQQKMKNIAQSEPALQELLTEYSQAEARYKMLSDKYAQAVIAEKEFTRTGSILPFDWARDGIKPTVEGPSRKTLLVYGLILSLIIGVVVAVWLDSIDPRLHGPGDVEKLLELPIIGVTPQLPGKNGMLPKLTHIYPLSAMAESYKILRTNLLFELRDKPFKTLMVATGRPGQGATTTICNVAIALAQIGKKIILIDADMRRPSLHKFFGVANEAGLSTLLRGDGTLTDAFQKTDVENLIVVPAGPQPLNPSELLGSDRMQDLVKRLEEHCDLVLFDSPSTVVFSDGPMLASWVDAVLMVVSANQAPSGTEVKTRELLKKARANVIGVVVNKMLLDDVDSCRYYSHYYADSAPQTPDAALESGNEHNGNGSGKKIAPPKAKAIPATAEATKPDADAETAGDDNPFPD
ncbi:MAG: polysaccharide biosynthesis tyrosine autokinase [Armatimonadota bacterium]|nr:polysaccharide biosynthesis tyrosine autokinase [bacterium]